jgi:hypothetical protein
MDRIAIVQPRGAGAAIRAGEYQGTAEGRRMGFLLNPSKRPSESEAAIDGKVIAQYT